MPEPLDALSPLDGRYEADMAPLRAHFSEGALIRQRVAVEVAYAQALLTELGHPGVAAANALAERTAHFTTADAEAIKAIEARTRHDVKAVEIWLGELAPTIAPFIHLGLTSEDVNNLAYAGMQRDALEAVLYPALATVLSAFGDLAARHRDLPMLARTHGQPASPTTFGKEIGVFASRLAGEVDGLMALCLPAKLNGATGNFAAQHLAFPAIDWPVFSADFIRARGFEPSPLTTQIEPRDGYAALYDQLRRIGQILLDTCQDLWRYTSDGYLVQQARAGEVGSSTMPHKINPIDFENAEGNLGLAAALFGHFGEKLTRSRLQRDLSDSTVMRNVGVAFGHFLMALKSLARGLERITPDGDRMAAVLHEHPEVLAEAYQVILRAGGDAGAYDRLLALTRGKAVTREGMRAFAKGEAALARIADLEADEFVGLAPALADHAAAVAHNRAAVLRQQARA